ncbi:NADH-quinone oxidoreductase subunit N [Marinithermus hydrothermalis]|uniref:NADH-quinone oxidoreductase subunit N n=1 Tax=Marinithermus hydrothermalis (strain DSM 14884 / JCM 11576 / T1) TaxID=869210 RepID=F2NM12_MARHT|nr:NADH-quinone oxidoreductase subunit N [Marinithermus hydrothermalis]AEB11269.1 proton-translocating NADH-quinone oxidoreductase, chain N [Marinithermus hydrothermalis DSM 14884]
MSVLITLLLTALLATFAGFVMPSSEVRRVSGIGFALALVFLGVNWGEDQVLFNGLYVFDAFARGITLVVLLAALMAVLVGTRYLAATQAERFEYYALLGYAVLGAHVIGATTNLVVMLIGIEILSIPLYVLAGFRRDLESYEASVKYFLLGAAASGILFYGIVLHYGATGAFTVGAAGEGLLYFAAMALILTGLGFKVALVPFQWWTPDVYQGSPTPVTLFMASGVKAAAFAALARVLVGSGLEGPWGALFALMVALTVLFGNLAALVQNEAKRVLAYSSIAHAGYAALALLGPDAGPALGYYLFAYAISTGLAFGVLSVVDEGKGVPYGALRGLLQRAPLLGVGWVFAMLSLAGIPPFVGFWAKYLVILEAARGGAYGLVVFALLTSVVAAFYYLRLLALAAFSAPASMEVPAARSGARFALVVAAGLVVLLGLWAGLGFGLFANAAALAP